MGFSATFTFQLDNTKKSVKNKRIHTHTKTNLTFVFEKSQNSVTGMGTINVFSKKLNPHCRSTSLKHSEFQKCGDL